jgi:hypothetical protein
MTTIAAGADDDNNNNQQDVVPCRSLSVHCRKNVGGMSYVGELRRLARF